MKGYTKDNVLYVFPQEVGQIPSVGAGVTEILVQQEDLAAWKTANSDYASIMKAYNYNMMTVQKKVWADHVNDNITVSPELAWSAESATAQIGETNSYPTLTNPHSVTVTYSSSDTEKATIDQSTGTITLVAAGNTTISAVFAGNDTYDAQTVTYTLTVNAAKVSPELAWSAESATVTIGADDNVFPTLSNPHSVSVWYTTNDECIDINQETGEITLLSAGTADVDAIFDGDDTYEEQDVTYELTVNAAPVINVEIDGSEYLSDWPEDDHIDVGETGTLTVADEYSTATVTGFYYPGDDEQETPVQITFSQDVLTYSWTQPDATVYITVSYSPL